MTIHDHPTEPPEFDAVTVPELKQKTRATNGRTVTAAVTDLPRSTLHAICNHVNALVRRAAGDPAAVTVENNVAHITMTNIDLWLQNPRETIANTAVADEWSTRDKRHVADELVMNAVTVIGPTDDQHPTAHYSGPIERRDPITEFATTRSP